MTMTPQVGDLRDTFAIAIVTGVVANDGLLSRILRDKPIEQSVYAAVAARVYELADAMLKER